MNIHTPKFKLLSWSLSTALNNWVLAVCTWRKTFALCIWNCVLAASLGFIDIIHVWILTITLTVHMGLPLARLWSFLETKHISSHWLQQDLRALYHVQYHEKTKPIECLWKRWFLRIERCGHSLWRGIWNNWILPLVCHKMCFPFISSVTILD